MIKLKSTKKELWVEVLHSAWKLVVNENIHHNVLKHTHHLYADADKDGRISTKNGLWGHTVIFFYNYSKNND